MEILLIMNADGKAIVTKRPRHICLVTQIPRDRRRLDSGQTLLDSSHQLTGGSAQRFRKPDEHADGGLSEATLEARDE